MLHEQVPVPDLTVPLSPAAPRLPRIPVPTAPDLVEWHDVTGRGTSRTRSRDELRGLSDSQLMGRTALREPAAFDVFYARHIVSARAASFRVVHDAQRADDVCQEAFLAVWRAAARFDPALGNARSWVLAIVRNRAIDALRISARIKSSEVADDALTWRLPAPSCDGTECTAMRNGEAVTTRALLDLLDPDQRRVVELAFFGGYSHAEIATMLGLPLGTVKARVKRGLLRMRHGVGPVG